MRRVGLPGLAPSAIAQVDRMRTTARERESRHLESMMNETRIDELSGSVLSFELMRFEGLLGLLRLAGADNQPTIRTRRKARALVIVKGMSEMSESWSRLGGASRMHQVQCLHRFTIIHGIYGYRLLLTPIAA
jgi:hypothetical protein